MSEDIKQSDESQEIEETAATSQEDSSELDENQSKNEEESNEAEETSKPQEAQDEYSKALEEERARRERAEKKILDLKKKSKESNIDPEVVITAAREAVRQELEASKAEEMGTVTEEFISALSSSPSERELIKYHYDNTINRTGTNKASIYQDLTRAKLLANEKKLVQENSELKKALMSRQTASATPQFSGQPVREERVNFTPAEKALIKGLKLKEADIVKKLKK